MPDASAPSQANTIMPFASIDYTPTLITYIKKLTKEEFIGEMKSSKWKKKDKQKLKRIRNIKRWYLKYDDAREIVGISDINTRKSYVQWRSLTPGMNLFLPARPDVFYRNRGWTSWHDFLTYTCES